MIREKTDKQALLEWDEFLESIRASTTYDQNETPLEQKKRVANLEENPEEWFKYYFPKFSFAEPAPFHIRSTKKFVHSKRIYHRRAWARGLAKSTRRMMEVFYLLFAKKVRGNMLLVSKSESNAIRLLDPYRANLEANQRLINDYGTQERPGKWTDSEFTTRGKHTFRAVGKGQNPRGARNEEMRMNLIVFDDVDDDEECRNEERLDTTWKWIQEAVIPTVDIAKPYWICFDNNIIAEDSIAVRAGGYATLNELVNIRDEKGKSVWNKNSEADIDEMLSYLSYESGQKEYFNNPMSQGKTFKEIKWGKCPPISSLPFVLAYADPATSNKDKPTIKSGQSNSHKAVFLLGKKGMHYYVYTGFLDVMNNNDFVDCLFQIDEYAAKAKQRYCYIENNTLQDPFYQQVLQPLIFAKNKERKTHFYPMPDTRDKPDKWFRIEGKLEPLVRLGLLVFNIDEKENPDMKRLEAQFKAAKPTSKRLDGPDAIEGAVTLIDQKSANIEPGAVKALSRKPNKNRY